MPFFEPAERGGERHSHGKAEREDQQNSQQLLQALGKPDQCAEEAYRLLMIAQYRQGDRGLAIRTYDRCVVALSDELDVDPMPETQVLYETIVAARPVSL